MRSILVRQTHPVLRGYFGDAIDRVLEVGAVGVFEDIGEREGGYRG